MKLFTALFHKEVAVFVFNFVQRFQAIGSKSRADDIYRFGAACGELGQYVGSVWL